MMACVSRGAAIESSPRLQPWVCMGGRVKPRQGRQNMELAGTTAPLPPPQGLGSSSSADPRLTPWANFLRAAGASTESALAVSHRLLRFAARRFQPAVQLNERRDRAIHGVGDRPQHLAFVGGELAVAGHRVRRRLEKALLNDRRGLRELL